eukprot:TRINITY_DN1234_c0_g1_i1.p1 TRINITY_DN1234_c0_g1~~TRINITY_DN1234_c0_g1_i1.p1  ORF type:complete len:895 (+),score=240.50 TRINITY_DN1234_c0_g1_i1:97-2781(+)
MKKSLLVLSTLALGLGQKQSCGGIAGIPCPLGYECVTKCASAVADCMGTCEKPQLPTCASTICTADSYCVDDAVTGARCVPLTKPSCATMRCSLGYHCEENDVEGPSCVPSEKPTCATVACIATTTCKDHPERGPVCVPIELPTCALIDCEDGAECKDDDVFGAECRFNCYTREVWTPQKSRWCCENEKLGCPVRPPPPAGKKCKTNKDCSEEEFCRQVQQPSAFGCGDDMECVPRAKEGESCGGFTPPCFANVCSTSLKCVSLNMMIADIPGTCLKPILSVGEVCRIDDGAMRVMDRSADCPKETQCTKSNRGKGEWRCESENAVADCDLRKDELVLCGAGGICKKGYKCTGCRQTCSCDSNGQKVCSKECRPTCEKVEDKTDCMAQPFSEWKSMGCKSYSCFGYVKSPSADEMKYCCEMTGRYCDILDTDKFDCKSDPKGWSFDQRKWCCEAEEVGCPVPQFDCQLPDDSIQIMMNTDGLLQTAAAVGTEMWNDEKAAYCCEHFQVGCPSDKELFDCDWSRQTFAAWSEKQSEWCCSVKGVRCPIVIDEVVEKCQAKSSERALWDEETRKYCCLVEGTGCASEKYDCYGDNRMVSEWSDDQREWCCNEENIGCKIDCRAPSDLITKDTDKQACCESKGLHCPPVVEEQEEVPKKGNKKSFRLSFKGSIAKIMENPKRFLKKFRITVLRAAKVVKSSGLLIKYVGGLMNENEIPPQDARQRWGVSFPKSWNSQLFADEQVTTRSVATLGHGVSSVNELRTVGDEGAFVEFEITDDNEAVVIEGSEILSGAVDESRVGGGPLQDNGDGSTMILEPVGKGIDELPPVEVTPKEDSDDNDNTILFVIIGVLTALCMGGVVGFTVYRRSQATDTSSSVSVKTSSFFLNTVENHEVSV